MATPHTRGATIRSMKYLSGYPAALLALELPLRWLTSGFGLTVAAANMLLMWPEWRPRRDPRPPALSLTMRL